jgi:hypothetical protein
MNRPLLLYWSFLAGLIGGLLILIGAVIMTLMMSVMGNMMGMMPMESWMSLQGRGLAGMAVWMLVWGALTSGTVLVGATQVRAGKAVVGWGVAMVIAGVLSFLAMGGLLIGGLAAVSAGVLAFVASGPELHAATGQMRHA